jgi:hypothetical protein
VQKTAHSELVMQRYRTYQCFGEASIGRRDLYYMLLKAIMYIRAAEIYVGLAVSSSVEIVDLALQAVR